jgi:DNA polymerase-4
MGAEGASLPRVILHLDMDAFYAAVEIRDDPGLAGKPLIIGHRGRRGVVSTCSYEARRFGVHSAMPSVTAERLCPGATWLPGRMGVYVAVSRQIREILRECSPLVQPISIDEAFLDLTGIAADLDEGRRIGRGLKDRIRSEHRLGASVGVSPNKFLAKVASDLEKPDGLVVLSQEDVPQRLWPLPVRRLWGVGPRTAERLHAGGLQTIGDLLRVPEETLAGLVGQGSAAHLRALARGEDHRPVRASRAAKSISEERTYCTDLRRPEDIDRALLARAEGVSRELRREGLVARTVHLKVRTGDFTTWTRSKTLPAPTRYAEPVVEAARELLRERIRLGGKGVRLLGVGVSDLRPEGSGQGELFAAPGEERSRRVARATDAVRKKLGERAITRARLLDRPRRQGGEDPEEASSLPSVD